MHTPGLYSFAVLVNTVLDMWLIWIMGRGWRSDALNDPEALVRRPSMQNAIFTQLCFYLWPCTLLLPFMIEPIVLNVAPYFLAKWLVRSRKGCTKKEAEECLMAPPFDLNRYGDNLINIMMVCLFFFLTAVTLWWIFLMLSISLAFIYAWDCYRFKRGVCRTHFATEDIDILARYIMAIPCAILASGFVFKLAGGQKMVSTWSPDEFFKADPELWQKVTAAFFGHLVVHWALLTALHYLPSPPARQDGAGTPRDEVPYENTAGKICCNWFNANPVHCIRSRYLYEHSPPHVFYQPGREYLHKRNDTDVDALIIYEAEEFVEEEDVFQDLHRSATKAFRDAKD